MMLAVWNCFYVPYVVAFMSVADNIVLAITSVMVNFAYFLDIVVYMRTTYIDLVTGEEVSDSVKILKTTVNQGN